MQYLPICLRLHNAPVVLVGGGTVGTRKARLLLRAGANLTVVAPEIGTELEQQLADYGGVWQRSRYVETDLHGKILVVAATPDRATNEQIYRDATALSIPVNVVDAPDLCSFIFPSIVDRDPLLIAISSSGTSPVLARILRRKIEAMVPAAYGRVAEFAGRLRQLVKENITQDTPRRLFWEQAMEGTIAEQVLAGREDQAEQRLRERLRDTSDLLAGEVYLIGAGPGDPDLLTFKAARLLQSADVVLYDRLVSPVIVDMARRDAERIYVGKKRADHAVAQTEINQLLLELAQQGKRVVRLKGGDPFIFGRGGEEIASLAAEHIPFQVVPGVTAASGCASYAGIPLTHRDYSQSCIFVTGQIKEGELDLNWTALVQPRQTVVVYMGLRGLKILSQKLQEHGLDADTPAALIQQGTTEHQKVWISTIADLPSLAQKEQPVAPTMVIIGEVVKLHKSLAWF